jgi:predicted amidophosphoribosyltransferase
VRAIIDLVAPERCVACGRSADGELCVVCASDVVVLDDALCPRCGGPMRAGRAATSGACPCADLGGFRRARSLVVFVEPARTFTLGLKRRARASSVAAVGDLLASLARREGLAQPGVIVTHVPAGRTAARRGFDHAELIARATARALDADHERLLVRARQGPRQADVPLADRRTNVRGRFAARPVDRPVLLVDDVFTTGATAEACATALRAAGAPAVDVLTWARTLRRRA